MKYKKTVLNNGLRVITVPMRETRTTTVMAMAGVGSRYESEKEAGISHFLEHMFFKGTKKRPSALSIAEELDAVGGEYNAFTAKDRTGYYVKTDADHMEAALDVIADIYLNSKINPEEIEREKGAIIQEINMYEDSPMQSVGDVFENLLYFQNPLGREIIGCKETVKSFQRENFLRYREKFYAAGNTVLCVAGKFNEKKVIQKAKEYFGGMKKGRKPEIGKISERQSAPEVKIRFKKTDQTHLIIGNRAYHENHKDRFALGALSVILGGNMSSRLFIEVRERRGLAYYVRTFLETFEECGYIATQAGVAHENLQKTIEIIKSEYQKISSQKISPKELQKAKDYIKGKSAMGLESSNEVAAFFVNQAIRRRKIMTPGEIFAKIDKITAADILRVAGDVFQNKTLNLAVIGPHKNESELKKMLAIGG